jgi:hypothetical protein
VTKTKRGRPKDETHIRKRRRGGGREEGRGGGREEGREGGREGGRKGGREGGGETDRMVLSNLASRPRSSSSTLCCKRVGSLASSMRRTGCWEGGREGGRQAGRGERDLGQRSPSPP